MYGGFVTNVQGSGSEEATFEVAMWSKLGAIQKWSLPTFGKVRKDGDIVQRWGNAERSAESSDDATSLKMYISG
jgi:hypothetical protein